MNKILIFNCLFIGLSVISAQAEVKPGFQFTFGATSLPVNSVTSSPTGKKDFMGDLYNPLGFKYNFSSGFDYHFGMVLSTTKLSLITNKDKDGGLNSYITQLGLDMFFGSTSNFNFKTQMGILQYEMKGAGGQKQLNNGQSVSTFDLPSKTKNSQILYIGGGAFYDFGSANLEASLNIASPFSNVRRSYFLSLMLGVPL